MKSGDRVEVLLSADDEAAVFLGYGVYEGDFPVGPEAGGLASFLGNSPNPRILLDSGKTVWGCECWWGPEDQVRKFIARRTTLIERDIDDVRREQAQETEKP